MGINQLVFGNGLAPVQIFHAIPSSVYSTHKRRAVGGKNRLKESSGQQVQKHATFAPASQKLLGFRLRSHKLGTVPFVFIGTVPNFVNHARFAFKRFFLPAGLRKI
ncbi:MAG: hypothetical protein WBC20_07265 [Candidatus Aminicenantaceae bacterium]